MFGSLIVQTYRTPSCTTGSAASVYRANRSAASSARQNPSRSNQRGTVKCMRVTIGSMPASWQASTMRR